MCGECGLLLPSASSSERTQSLLIFQATFVEWTSRAIYRSLQHWVLQSIEIPRGVAQVEKLLKKKKKELRPRRGQRACLGQFGVKALLCKAGSPTRALPCARPPSPAPRTSATPFFLTEFKVKNDAPRDSPRTPHLETTVLVQGPTLPQL